VDRKAACSPSKDVDPSRSLDGVTTAAGASQEVRCVSECCKRPARRVIWFPTPRRVLAVSDGTCGFYRTPFPAHLRKRVHPLNASRLSRVLPSRARPASPDVEHLPWGCLPSSRHQPAASLLPGPNPAALPSATFLTSSTVFSATGLAGLFHPAATSRVRSPGGFPHRQPKCLVGTPCPRAGWLWFATGSCPPAPRSSAPPSGL
jgi:hypothetical protein